MRVCCLSSRGNRSTHYWEARMGLFGPSNPVFEMLEHDHEKVKGLFDQFEAAKDARTKQRIMNTTLLELEVHAKLEESLIYPAIRKKIDADKIMDEALEEHHVAHTLINELKRGAGKRGAGKND